MEYLPEEYWNEGNRKEKKERERAIRLTTGLGERRSV